MGRKKLPPHRKRSYRYEILLSPIERRELEVLAEARRTHIGGVLHELIEEEMSRYQERRK